VSPEQLGAAFDLLAAWQDGGVYVEHDGQGFATGPGASVATSDVMAALADRPPGAVACGALPFSGGGSLVLADAQVRRTDPFVTARIGPATQPVLVTGLIPADAFLDAELTMAPSPAVYAGAVAEAARRVRAGDLRKVVLARTIRTRTPSSHRRPTACSSAPRRSCWLRGTAVRSEPTLSPARRPDRGTRTSIAPTPFV
jgi:hypothetical protein